MPATRLSFRRLSNGLHITSYFATVKGELVAAMLDPWAFTCAVVRNESEWEVSEVSKAKSLTEAKKLAKIKLRAAGVLFYDEIRTRKEKLDGK